MVFNISSFFNISMYNVLGLFKVSVLYLQRCRPRGAVYTPPFFFISFIVHIILTNKFMKKQKRATGRWVQTAGTRFWSSRGILGEEPQMVDFSFLYSSPTTFFIFITLLSFFSVTFHTCTVLYATPTPSPRPKFRFSYPLPLYPSFCFPALKLICCFFFHQNFLRTPLKVKVRSVWWSIICLRTVVQLWVTA